MMLRSSRVVHGIRRGPAGCHHLSEQNQPTGSRSHQPLNSTCPQTLPQRGAQGSWGSPHPTQPLRIEWATLKHQCPHLSPTLFWCALPSRCDSESCVAPFYCRYRCDLLFLSVSSRVVSINIYT